MDITRNTFVLFFMLLSMQINAQTKLRQQVASRIVCEPAKKSDVKKNQRINYNNHNMIKKTDESSSLEQDNACYLNVVRRNGWYVGVGKKLTQDQISNLNCYYKLSNRNSAGNWTLMQAYQGTGDFTIYHGINTYLIRTYDMEDSYVSREWKEKLQIVCQWVFIGSFDGKTCIQEQGLDEEGNVMYSMVMTPTDLNNYYCTYIDSWGRPVYMRTDENGNDICQANFVEITRDSIGYEILARYYDRNGFPAKNRNGSYMLSWERDSEGKAIKVWALDVLGNPMVDEFGCSGEINRYDVYGNKVSRTNLDIAGNPAQNRDGVYGSWWTYDKYGNNIGGGSLDENGYKCSDNKGVYSYSVSYNERGIILNFSEFDKDGNLIKDDASHVAEKSSLTYNPRSEMNDEATSSDEDEDEDDEEDNEESLRKEYSIDSLENAVTIMYYNDNKFVKGTCTKDDPNRPNFSFMHLVTEYGAQTRLGYAYFYNSLIGTDWMGRDIIMGLNEFGEPAYITESNSTNIAFLYSIEWNGIAHEYDEYGIEINKEEMDSIYYLYPNVYCIEVTDTTIGYPIGVRNNDIILSLGKWRINSEVTSSVDSLSFAKEINKAEAPREMVVLRHHPKEKTSEVVTISLKAGTLEQLGILPHLIFYTQQEKKRLVFTAKSAGFVFKEVE